MPFKYLSIPPSPDIFTPSMPGDMPLVDMGAGDLPFGPGGRPLAPYHMPFRPFGPLAHLLPYLRRRIRFRRRFRRLHITRQLG